MEEKPKTREEEQPTPETGSADTRVSALPVATLRHLDAFAETLEEDRQAGALDQKTYERKMFSLKLLRAAKNPRALFGDKNFRASFTPEEFEQLSDMELSAESLQKRLRTLEGIAAEPEDKIEEAFRRAEKAGAVTPKDIDRLVEHIVRRDNVPEALADLIAEIREELGVERAPSAETPRQAAIEAAAQAEKTPAQPVSALEDIKGKIHTLQWQMLQGDLPEDAGSFNRPLFMGVIDDEEEEYLRQERKTPLDFLGDLYFKGIVAQDIERQEKLRQALGRISESGRPIPQECARALAQDQIGDREFQAVALAGEPKQALTKLQEKISRQIEAKSALFDALDPEQAAEELALAGEIDPRYIEWMRERVGQIKADFGRRVAEHRRREEELAESEDLYEKITIWESADQARRRVERQGRWAAELAAKLEAGEVGSITVFRTGVEAKLKSGGTLYVRKNPNQDLNAVFSEHGLAVDPQKLQGIEITVAGRGRREEDPEKFSQELLGQSLEIRRALEHFTKVPLERYSEARMPERYAATLKRLEAEDVKLPEELQRLDIYKRVRQTMLEEDFVHRLRGSGIRGEDIPDLVAELRERREIWEEVLGLEARAQSEWDGFLDRVPGYAERAERMTQAREEFAKKPRWELEPRADSGEEPERVLDDESAVAALQDVARLLQERRRIERRVMQKV